MRVITGAAKGRKLQMVPDDGTRPITDRAKEALFSILGHWIEGTRVLDLFGGTGSVGIESLSRGAAAAHFIDMNRKAVDTIRANLRHCQLEADAVVEKGDSFAFLKRYQGEPFDLIYVAPPQYQNLWHKALEQIDARPDLLSADGEVVVQIHPKEDAPATLNFLYEYDRRRYGSVLLLFFAAQGEEDADGEDVDGEEEDWEEEDDDDDTEAYLDEDDDLDDDLPPKAYI